MNGIDVQLALGSVQFGLAYGVAGRGEPVPPLEVRELLAYAWEEGVRLIDTAPVYGDIEQRLLSLADGRAFDIVSKIPALPAEVTTAGAHDFVARSIAQSRERLGAGLCAMLFHRGDDLLEEKGESIWRAASDALRGTNIELGGSFYSPADAARARACFPISIAQLPGNALDQRLLDPTASLEGVEVHLRSVFLQGLLVNDPGFAARRVPKAVAPLQAWQDWCLQRNVAPLDAALGVARGLPRVSRCIVGVDRRDQLREIVTAWRRAAPLGAPALACADEDIIDPRRWKAA